MRIDLMGLEYDETIGFDDVVKNKTTIDIQDKKKTKFEDNLHKFLGLENAMKDFNISQHSSRSRFDESESGYTNNFLTNSNVNRNKVMPIEEIKVLK